MCYQYGMQMTSCPKNRTVWILFNAKDFLWWDFDPSSRAKDNHLFRFGKVNLLDLTERNPTQPSPVYLRPCCTFGP